jgi:acetylornithine/N-succinyldiaminopimelate aminotransferase
MTSQLMMRADQVMASTYKRLPVVLVKGSGCTLWDENGKSYTDFVAGIAVCNLGHAHPGIAAALARQAAVLWHVSNLYYTVPQTDLADWLVAHSFADRVFFCNSGAEANEAAIKLARRYFKERGEPQRYRIISMEQSFHGRTMATLSATGQDKIKQGFAPVLEGFDFVVQRCRGCALPNRFPDLCRPAGTDPGGGRCALPRSGLSCGLAPSLRPGRNSADL